MLIILYGTIIQSLLVDARFVTFLDQLICTEDPNFFNGTCVVDYDGNNHETYRVNFNTTLVASGINYVLVNIKMGHCPPGKRNETVKIMDMTVDVCSIFKKGRQGNILFMETIKFFNLFGRIPTSCPIKPGFYYMRNATMNAFQVPPIFTTFFAGRRDTNITYTIYAKVNNSKKLIPVIKVTLLGGYKNI